MKNLLKIQSELKAHKGRTNSFGGYKYRSCEDILEAVKPLLKETESVLTISDDIQLVGDRVYVKATVTLKTKENSFTTSAFAREPLDKKGMDASQITGMASSYARKYALNGLFAIDDTQDADTMDNTEPKKEATKIPPATQLLEGIEALGYTREEAIKILKGAGVDSKKPDTMIEPLKDIPAFVQNWVHLITGEVKL